MNFKSRASWLVATICAVLIGALMCYASLQNAEEVNREFNATAGEGALAIGILTVGTGAVVGCVVLLIGAFISGRRNRIDRNR